MKEGLTEMAKIRTFICIELPEDVRRRLRELQSDLEKYNANIRWVRPESIHLTLKFLGDVEEHSINDIARATEMACSGIAQFTINVQQTGVFPNWRHPRVLWVGIDEPEGNLLKIKQEIELQLTELGYVKEDRKFSPHLTIGRVKSMKMISDVMQDLQKREFFAGNFLAKEVVVMKSDLRPTGAVYTALQKVQLTVRQY